MIEIGMNGIKKNYGFKQILDGVDLEIMTGDRVAIVGRNGAGKTTLFRILAGEESADSGSCSVRRGATLGMLEQIPALYDTAARTGEVLMEPFAAAMEAEANLRALEARMASEPGHLEEIMAEYAALQDRYTALGGYEMEERRAKIVTGFGLGELLERPFNALSGGQKTIVKLASTILAQPDILLLDEPTNHLDIKTLDWFEEFIRGYRGTVVIISHDRYFLDRVTTKTVWLEKGRCAVFRGNYSFSIAERERLLLLEFEQYKNQQKKIAAMQAAIKRYRDWGARGDNEMFFRKAAELEKRMEKMALIERPRLGKTPLPIRFEGDRSGHEVLRLTHVSLTLGGLRLLEGAGLLLVERERLCLLGGNGTGKTSLLRVILGENGDYTGTVKRNPGARLGYIPQEIRFADETASVLDTFRREVTCSQGEARGILARYRFFGEGVFQRVSGLSGGEKVLLKLAILLQNRVNLLVLDEPTNHIDIDTRELLEEALSDYTGTLLFVSHDRYFIRKLATRVVEIREHSLQQVDDFLTQE